MKNQDQESRRGLANVAVDQGNTVTSWCLELRQVGVGVSVPQQLCDRCVRLSSCGMKVLLCGTPGLSGVSGDYLTGLFFVGRLSTAAWREDGLFFLKSSWPEGLGSFVCSPGVL